MSHRHVKKQPEVYVKSVLETATLDLLVESLFPSQQLTRQAKVAIQRLTRLTPAQITLQGM